MSDDYWIPISLLSDFAHTGIEKALADCYTVHLWSLGVLQERFAKTLKVPTVWEISINLTKFIRERKLYAPTQRYALNKAMEKAHREFRQVLFVNEYNQIEFPSPISREEYTEFDIPSRKIWPRYLEKYGGISTVYGLLMLDGDWKEILRQQAKENKLPMSKFAACWQSVTVKKGEGYEIRFNLQGEKK